MYAKLKQLDPSRLKKNKESTKQNKPIKCRTTQRSRKVPKTKIQVNVWENNGNLNKEKYSWFDTNAIA